MNRPIGFPDFYIPKVDQIDELKKETIKLRKELLKILVRLDKNNII